MPLNFKHINGDEQILDGSIGTSLLADGSVTAAKLAIGAITSSSLLVDSNIDFNNFEALQFRVENVNFFPIPGNPGRLIWRTDLRDLYVDTDFTLNITSAAYVQFEVGSIIDGTNMSVNSTVGITAGDALLQGGIPFAEVDITEIIDATNMAVASTVGISVGNVLAQDAASTIVTGIVDATHLTVTSTTGFTIDVAVVSTPYALATVSSVTDATHLAVSSTVGFVGQATTSVNFGIVTVTNSTDLEVDNSTAISVGDVIVQGLTSTTVTAVTDLTHIVVVDTTGFVVGIADVLVLIDILAIPNSTDLTVSKTTGFGPGDPITQGLASTTITSVIDGTHLVVASTSGFALNAATDSTVIVDDTSNANAGMYLRQGAISSLILNVVDATHLAVVDASLFVAGVAFIGNWVSINDGGSVTSIYADGNPHLQGNVQLASGTNVDLAQLSQTITVNVPAAGVTGQLQFNNDVLNQFGADSNLFWDNVLKRLGIGNSSPTTTLDVTGTAHVSGPTTLSSTLDVTNATTLNDTLDVTNATTLNNTLDVVGLTTLHDSLHVVGTSQQDGAVTIGSTLDVTAATTLLDTLDVTNQATFSAQVGIGTVSPDPSAQLDITSVTRGLLIPRVTTAQRDAIVSPAVGLQIYNTDTTENEYWNGTAWLVVGNTAVAGVNGDVQFNNNGIFGANPNFFWDDLNTRLGIGNAAPVTVLDITGDGHFSSDLTVDGQFLAKTGLTGYAFTGNPSIGMWTPNADTLEFTTGTSGLFVFNAAANPALRFDESGLDQIYSGWISGLYQLNSRGDIALRTDFAGTPKIWNFDVAGNLTVPASAHINPASGHLFITTDQLVLDGASGSLVFTDDNNSQILFNNAANSTVYAAIYSTPAGPLRLNEQQVGQSIEIQTSASLWTFADSGLLTVPGAIDLATHQIHNVTDPTLAQDAATKNYVDGPSHTVAGSNTWVQYNNGGNFGASLNFSYDNSVKAVSIIGDGSNFAALKLQGTANGGAVFFTNDDASVTYALIGGTSSSLTIQVPAGPLFLQGTGGVIIQSDVDMQSHTISNLNDPTLAQDAATKNYVDGGAHTVAGSNTEIQFNNSGVFGASPNLTWDGSEIVVGPVAGIIPVSTILAGEIQLLDSGSSPTAYIDLQAGSSGYIHITDNSNIAPDNSAILQAHSVTRGFLAPRMTTVQRDLIVSPATGLQIYNITTNAIEVWDGSEWNSFGQNISIPNGSATIALATAIPIATPGIDVSTNGVIFTPQLTIWKSGAVDGNGSSKAAEIFGESTGELDIYPVSGGVDLRIEYPHVIIDQTAGFTDADSSSILELKSTVSGFLPPRMTTAQKTAIVLPAIGLTVYDTDLNLLQVYNGAWVTVGQATFEQEVFNITGPGNVFNLGFTPITNSQVVYYNGLALAPGVSEDYTILGNVVTLDGSIVLANGDKILIVYSHY